VDHCTTHEFRTQWPQQDLANNYFIALYIIPLDADAPTHFFMFSSSRLPPLDFHTHIHLLTQHVVVVVVVIFLMSAVLFRRPMVLHDGTCACLFVCVRVFVSNLLLALVCVFVCLHPISNLYIFSCGYDRRARACSSPIHNQRKLQPQTHTHTLVL